jgi:hypothetical protein
MCVVSLPTFTVDAAANCQYKRKPQSLTIHQFSNIGVCPINMIGLKLWLEKVSLVENLMKICDRDKLSIYIINNALSLSILGQHFTTLL